jgi:hypothetical protein
MIEEGHGSLLAHDSSLVVPNGSEARRASTAPTGRLHRLAAKPSTYSRLECLLRNRLRRAVGRHDHGSSSVGAAAHPAKPLHGLDHQDGLSGVSVSGSWTEMEFPREILRTAPLNSPPCARDGPPIRGMAGQPIPYRGTRPITKQDRWGSCLGVDGSLSACQTLGDSRSKPGGQVDHLRPWVPGRRDGTGDKNPLASQRQSGGDIPTGLDPCATKDSNRRCNPIDRGDCLSN